MQFKIGNVCLILTALAVFSFSGSAQTGQDKTLSPYFFVQGDPDVDRLPLKDTRVEINVSGIIADVTVLQTYRNEGSRPINARYVFPASTRAAVYAMRMQIGDQVIVAKIKEREKAKRNLTKPSRQAKAHLCWSKTDPMCFR